MEDCDAQRHKERSHAGKNRAGMGREQLEIPLGRRCETSYGGHARQHKEETGDTGFIATKEQSGYLFTEARKLALEERSPGKSIDGPRQQLQLPPGLGRIGSPCGERGVVGTSDVDRLV